MIKKIDQSRQSACWDVPPRPSRELLGLLPQGPLSAKDGQDPARIERAIAILRGEVVERPVVFIGTGTCGLGAGAAKTMEGVRTYLAGHKIDAEIRQVGCIGLCSEEPIMDVQIPGRPRISFGSVTAENFAPILDQVLAGKVPDRAALGQFRCETLEPWAGVPFLDEHPFLILQTRVVLPNCGVIDPCSIDAYIANGGYQALAETLSGRTPEEVCSLIELSGLRGRGGGGFPTGRKWHMGRTSKSDEKYLVCNADEGDPGAFMDRAVGESDPHRLLEGMAIAAYAIGASTAYIYIRAEYPLAIKNLELAIRQAKQYGLLGENILDSGFNLKILIKMGAGAFVCGEETALLQSIEGKRGMPRPRPPYPTTSGLFGKPTVINNVETLANVPGIILMGGAAFAAIGTGKSKGTKVFALSGMVNRTGLIEVPMGTTLRQVVFDVGDGIPGGKACKGVQIGGPSGGCIPLAHMDVPTDYEALKEFGAIMGSGGLVVLDETTCMVDLAKYFMEFIQNESCGKCIPCREGTRRMLEILQAITRSPKSEAANDALLRMQGIMHLKELCEVIKNTSLCGLGQTAPNPVLSTLRWFRDEYEAHIFERRCPSGACKDLVGAPCQAGCPVGTEVWRYVANIARGDYDEAYRVIRQANPFPSVCARVCHHPCERKCRAGAGGESIAIRSLKRFVVDRVAPETYKPSLAKASSHPAKVAIVGAGPAGLTAASHLARIGHQVTVFEREAKPGGMLTGAIPEYRMPRDVLNREIAQLCEQVEVKYGQSLGKDFTVEGLLQQGFKAVFVAIGAHQSKKLGLAGEDVRGVLHGINFLKAYNYRGENLARGRVGIVGGGNSAIDAARVALRQPGVTSVTVYYRRTEAEMPAYREEIEAAIEEGVKLEILVAPVAVLAKDGVLTGMRFNRNQLGPRDASGRQRPVTIPDSEFEQSLDTLIIAISEEPEAAVLDGLELSRGGTLKVNPESFITSRPGVFGGGDVVFGPNTIVEAVAAGKSAALMIGRYLDGRPMKSIAKVAIPKVYIESTAADEEEDLSGGTRVHSPLLPVDQRQRNFAEVELCLSEAAALGEARRCLRCDLHFTQPA
jgi:NADH-quinone oxidoreductase subunit F